MTETSVSMISLSKDELIEIVKNAVKLELNRHGTISAIKQENKNGGFLKRSEVCDLLKVSAVTLHNWEKRNVLVPLKIGGRVLYNKGEVYNKLES